MKLKDKKTQLGTGVGKAACAGLLTGLTGLDRTGQYGISCLIRFFVPSCNGVIQFCPVTYGIPQ